MSQREEQDNNNNNNNKEEVTVVVVARHGERLDYVSRDATPSTNWVATAAKPYDPPLTEHGMEQASTLGRHLRSELGKTLQLPAVSAIYASPFLRCRQTALAVKSGLESSTIKNGSQEQGCGNHENIPVRVELGLAESINEQWYRSWSLPGADGTWGYKINGQKKYDPATLHPAAKEPVQNLLQDWKTDHSLDLNYRPRTSLTEPYSFDPVHLESRQRQRSRMEQALEAVLESGRTVLLVSHGGPVTHLFEELVGQPWYVHGESTYCCYSIYQKRRNGSSWEAVQVNESSYLHEANLHKDKYVTDTSE